MEKETEELIKRVALGAFIGTVGATVRAFLTKNENTWTKSKNFIAGVFFALLMSMILVNSNVSIMFQNIICGAAGSFVTTLWPIIETGVLTLTKIFFKKKQNEFENVGSSDTDKHTGGGSRNTNPSQYP